MNSDPAMKQLILQLNEKDQFIIEDLDETHVLMDASYVDRLQEKFDLALEENVYKLSDGTEVKSTW
jgi:TFIIH basal transcription factor complex TTD-A subunit